MGDLNVCEGWFDQYLFGCFGILCEVVDILLFFVLELFSFIIGENVVFDGGFIMSFLTLFINEVYDVDEVLL